jgi:hypothetical protein
MRLGYLPLVFMLVLAGACSSESDDGGDSGNQYGNATPGGNSNGVTGSGSAGTGSGLLGNVPGATIGANGLPTACAQGNVHTSLATPTVILVVDGSCSMSTNYPSNDPSAIACIPNPMSRWSAMRNALLDPNSGVVSRLEGVVRFGLVVFGTFGQCPIPGQVINPALNNRGAIDQNFPQAPPGMFTPTGAALDYVYNNVVSGQAVLDADVGPQIVIPATDGEPNSCDDATTNYQPSLDALGLSQSKNVTTYVISLAAAAGEFHDHLQQLANMGANPGGGNSRTGTLYEPGTPQQLADQLGMLVGGAVGCDVALNGLIEPGSECTGTVKINGENLPCNDPNGWVLLDSRHIRLQGAACDRLTSQAEALLEADFPCESFTPD